MRTLIRPMLALALLFAANTARAEEPPVELPKLVSTGSPPKWKSIAELRKFADEGDAQASYDLALLHLEGAGEVELNVARALELYERAAKGGVADAWFRLGKIHHDGVAGVAVNRELAFVYYKQAAMAGVPEAQFNVGAMLASGRGVRRDYVDGLAWLIIAAKSGIESPAEQQLRDRLSRRKRDIEAAERRAEEILAEMSGKVSEPAPEIAPPQPSVPKAPDFKPDFSRPTVEPVKPDIKLPIAPPAPAINLPEKRG